MRVIKPHVTIRFENDCKGCLAANDVIQIRATKDNARLQLFPQFGDAELRSLLFARA